MSPNDVRELIRGEFDELLNKGTLAYADKVYTPHAMIHDSLMPSLPTGPTGMKELVKSYRAAFPDLTFRVEDMVVEKDRVAVRWSATGTHKNAFLGIAPTNRFGTVTGCSISRLENDRVAETWIHEDLTALVRNLGLDLPLKIETEVHA